MRHYLYLLIFTLLTFVSCETELPEGTWSKEPPVTPENPVTYQLSIDKTIIVAKAEGLSEAFSITSDDSWTVSTSEPWIKVSDTTGAGDKSVTVTVEANTGKEARSGSITVKGKSSGTKSISVSQPGKEYSLSVDKTDISVGAAEASETFTITSNDDWTVSTSEAWVKVSDATGNGNKTISVTIEANTIKEARTATITITGKNSEANQTITVIQEGKLFTLSVDKTAITAGPSGSTETITITSNDSWTATSDASWVTLSATSGNGDSTLDVSISLNSTTAERTSKITVLGTNSSVEKTITVTQQARSSLDTNGHEYVDLGLPSGLLWATCNVGASKPENYGDYFAWGETTTKSTYNWSTYKYCNGSNITLTKYNSSTEYGAVDNKNVLDIEDDAAHINWGGKWRIPTKEEQRELIDNCICKMTTRNGTVGYKFTSTSNQNSIFLPSSGQAVYSVIDNVGVFGEYWSSSVSTDYPDNAYYIYFFEKMMPSWNGYSRCFGLSIRPVCNYSD